METAELARIYGLLADETRLRIVALLLQGPLCVCHFQEILGISQVKTSRHLACLRESGLVEVTRNANWRIYRLPEPAGILLERNLACLRELTEQLPELRRDREARARLETKISSVCGV